MGKFTIDFVEYDENWVSMFEKEKELLADMFSDNLIRIEHFGSTSIPNLSAKPIIDIFVFVCDTDNMEKYEDLMIGRGYEPKGTQEFTDCKVFVKKNNLNKRTHKVNICKENNEFSVGALLFRDYLRLNKETRIKYENLKRELSQKYHDDPYAYGDGKQDFIKKTIERAKRQFA